MRIYDVSLPIYGGLPIYPGDPSVQISQAAAIAAGDAANVTLLHFGAHTGTHVDAPAHFIQGAAKVDSLSLDVLIGEALVVNIPNGVRAITAQDIQEIDPIGTKRLIFRTQNSDFWNNHEGGFRTDFTYLSPDGAGEIVKYCVRLVGIDYLSIDGFGSESFETHKVLLNSGIIIVEGLDLREIEPGRYEMFCLPLKIAEGSGDGAPARVILRMRS